MDVPEFLKLDFQFVSTWSNTPTLKHRWTPGKEEKVKKTAPQEVNCISEEREEEFLCGESAAWRGLDDTVTA